MILEIDNVELYFKNKRVLNGIYLKAQTGKITGILGQNGCGKSCLLNIVFGSLKPKYKLVRIDNNPILKPLFETGLVKFLPQFDFTPNHLRLKKVFNLFSVDWTDFIRTFDDFSTFEKIKFRNLSGGERRIVEIYLILKAKSKIVLLDEPFSHIAPLHIEKIKTIIELEKKGKAIIITDHMYRHIIDASDTIYLLHNGSTKLIDDLIELEDYKYLSEGSLA